MPKQALLFPELSPYYPATESKAAIQALLSSDALLTPFPHLPSTPYSGWYTFSNLKHSFRVLLKDNLIVSSSSIFIYCIRCKEGPIRDNQISCDACLYKFRKDETFTWFAHKGKPLLPAVRLRLIKKLKAEFDGSISDDQII